MPNSSLAALLVFLGGGSGALLRHLVNITVTRTMGTGLPWGIFAINVTGSLCMGLVAGWLAAKAGAAWNPQARLFLTTGILGGYTTFSAFSLDAVTLWERGESGMALLYVTASVALSILGLFAGLTLVRALT